MSSLRLRYPTELTKGLIYPVSFFIIIAIFAGTFNVYNNSKRLKEMPSRYAENKIDFIENELNRFEGLNGINKWWLRLNITWSLLIFIGVTLYFFKNNFFLQGIAIGLVFLGFSGLLIDSFAKERAEKYTEQLYFEKKQKKGST